jgi:hypothetical protein
MAPQHLRTNVKILYEQLNNPFCLTYSVSSALFYCGFKDQAVLLSSQAKVFADLHYDAAIAQLKHFMTNLAPTIGRPTIFGKRLKRHEKFRRSLSWENVFAELTPYPTLIIPVLPNGRITHALCVVDDLIFDSITSHALVLNDESVKWIFNGTSTEIFEALRFNTKCSPPGVRVEGKYNRKMILH